MCCVLSGLFNSLHETVIESKAFSLETLAFINAVCQAISSNKTKISYQSRVERGLTNARITLKTPIDAAPAIARSAAPGMQPFQISSSTLSRLPTTSTLETLPDFDSPSQLPCLFVFPVHPSTRENSRALSQAQMLEETYLLPPSLSLPPSVRETLQPQPDLLPQVEIQELADEFILTSASITVNGSHTSSHPG